MSSGPGPRPAARRRGLWLPALIATLTLTTVLGGIAVGHFYWSTLRSNLGPLDETLAHARERQRHMVEHFSQAQGLLLAQQRRLQEAEEALRTQESRLQAERAELEAARARLGVTSASRESLEGQTQARDLARRVDGHLAALADPGGLDATGATLQALSDWSTASTLVAESDLGATLGSALADSRDALAQLQASGPARLARRIEQLGARTTELRPQPGATGPVATPGGLSGATGTGHLGEQLQTALFALHRGDEALFRLALDTAGAWLAAFYDPTRPEVQAVRAEIAALRRVSITQDLKPLHTGLARLRAVLGEIIEETAAAGAQAIRAAKAQGDGSQ